MPLLKGISEGWKGWQVGLMVGVPVSVVGGVYIYKRYYRNKHASTPSPPKKLEAKDMKKSGNDHFKSARYTNAIEAYTRAIEMSDKEVTTDELSTFYQNRAAAYDQLKNYLLVIKDCSKALSLNPKYTKAMSRRAKAFQATGFLNEALEDITATCVLEGFSGTKNVQLADVIIKEICAEKANKKMELRGPKDPSANQIYRFMVSFTRDPVFNSLEYKGLSCGNNVTNDIHFNRSSYKRALVAFINEDYDHIIDLCDEEINNAKNDIPINNFKEIHNDNIPTNNIPNEDIKSQSPTMTQDGESTTYKPNTMENSDSGLVEVDTNNINVKNDTSMNGLNDRMDNSMNDLIGSIDNDDGIDLNDDPITDQDQTISYTTNSTTYSTTPNAFSPDSPTIHISNESDSLPTAEISDTSNLENKASSNKESSTPATVSTPKDYTHEAMLLKGTYEMLRSNNKAAISILSQLIDNVNASLQIRVNSVLKRAKVHSCEDRKTEASEDYEKAVQLDHLNPDVFMHRGQFHLMNERLNEAEEDFKTATKLEPSSPVPPIHHTFTRSRRAMVAEDYAALNEILKAFQQIINKFPLYAEAHIFYGQALQDLGKYEEANENYQKAFSLDSRNSNSLVHQGVLKLAWKNDVEGGLEELKKAVKIDPTNAFAHQALGTVLFQKGDVEEAIESIEKAITMVSSKTEMAHLFTILEAATVQTKVASKLGVNLNKV